MNMWKYISMATLTMMMVACSNEDAAIDNAKGKVMTLTTTLKMADNASTRTLTDEGTQITAEWAIDEEFDIYYQKTTDADGDPLTGRAKATVTGVSSGTATVTAQLTDAKDGGAIDFFYPYNHTGGTGTDHTTGQVGTLADINANFACMHGSGTMSVSGTTVSIDDGGVTMTQEICIWKFTFTDGANDITSAITNLKLAFENVTYNVNPTSQSAIYVAIYGAFPITTGAVTITATTAPGVLFTASKPTVTLQAGKMYSSNVALSPAGLFTINGSGKKVIFSPGNLQATYDGSEWSWAFAEHQWDYIGVNTANNKINGNGTVSSNGTVDLFGRSTASTYYGINNSTNTNYYTGSFSDWGNNVIGNYAANTWRTPTSTEWTYLFNTRVTTSGERYVLARVNDINGVILFPDDWVTSYYDLYNYNNADANYFSNNITSAEWANIFEAHGAVFLPAAGYRSGNSVSYGDAGQEGFYMSSSISGTYTYCVRFMERTASMGPEPGGMSPGALNPADELGCWCGGSVRLVRDAN